MRALILTLALVTGMAAHAQWHSDPSASAEEAATQRTEAMVQALHLDAAQQERMQYINLIHARGVRDVNTLQDETARNGRMEALELQREQALQQLLTEEQYQMLQEQREAAE